MQTCSTHCSGNGSCNQITGDCDNGCKDGWTGSKCGIQQNTGMAQTVKKIKYMLIDIHCSSECHSTCKVL